MRVAIVGARRRRQGLGPWVARGLAAAGAEVVACVGTSAATVEAARDDLRRLVGLECRGYTSGEALLDGEDGLDALAILSPAGTHAPWLRLALDAGLHTLCEKPFVWERDDAVELARQLVDGFLERGLVLRENCQWPYTLEAFDALHPGVRATAPSRFAMRLAPATPGGTMIGDALPHAISLLQELAPAVRARLEAVRFSSHAPDAEELDAAFTWVADAGPVAVEIALRLGPSQPREAGYTVDGHAAHRLIRLADYAQFFADGARLVDVPDPLPRLLADWVAATRSPSHEESARAAHKMVERMSALDQLRRAHGAVPT